MEKAARRSIAYTVFEKQTDPVAFQIEVADAALEIDTAHLHAYRAAADSTRRRHAMSTWTSPLVLGCALTAATRVLRSAVDTLVKAHGTSSMAEASPLQRVWRDMNVGSRHGILITEVNEELYGKALLGMKNTITRLI